MIETSVFEGFLSSLARISRTEYQIWDAKGNSIFTTGNGSSMELPVSELQILYKTINSISFCAAVWPNNSIVSWASAPTSIRSG